MYYSSALVTLHGNTPAMFAATTMASPTCSDADGGTITYSISSGDDVANKFEFPNVNAAVLKTTATTLDYETKTSYTLIVLMVDTGSTHTGTVTVYVQVGGVGLLKHILMTSGLRVLRCFVMYSLYLSLSLSLSLCLCLCLCICLSLSPTLYLSLARSLYLSLARELCLWT